MAPGCIVFDFILPSQASGPSAQASGRRPSLRLPTRVPAEPESADARDEDMHDVFFDSSDEHDEDERFVDAPEFPAGYADSDICASLDDDEDLVRFFGVFVACV